MMLAGATIATYVAPAIGIVLFATLVLPLGRDRRLLTALIAMVIERTAIRPMVGRPAFVVAIITIGIDIAVRVVAGGFIGLGAGRSPNPWGLDGVECSAASTSSTDTACRHRCGHRRPAGAAFVTATRRDWPCGRRPSTRRPALTQGVSVGRVFALSWA